MTIQTEIQDRKPRTVLISFALVLLIVSLWALTWLLLLNTPHLAKWEDRASFGEMFGVINALFAGLAFAGVIVTIYLQTKELALQRQELRDTRDEIHGQKEQMELQNQTLRQQSFENKFFQLLNLFHNIVISIDMSQGTSVGIKTMRGNDCFAEMYRKYQGHYKSTLEANQNLDLSSLINKSYLAFFREFQNDLSHYFRTLYHILKFIDRSDVPDKKFYTNLVRAQLSTFELTLLFYNCLSDYGKEKAKPLIERYSFLKNLPHDVLIDFPPHKKEEQVKLYEESAFKTILDKII